MIISQTPVRIPLGGGGTDLAEFYTKNSGGFLVSAAVNKFVLILVRRNFENGIRFTGYHKKEIVDKRQKLENPLVRATLEYLNFDESIEIVSMSDVRANCGLGTSSAFTVGLLNALYHYKGVSCSPEELAEAAICIEREMLQEAGGVQDQYVSSYGGAILMELDSAGAVQIEKLSLSANAMNQFDNHFLFIDTRSSRQSSKIQEATISSLKSSSNTANESMLEIRSIGRLIHEALITEKFYEIGELMHRHWVEKKKYGSSTSNPFIDELYSFACSNGALGGKLMGAGGGGFMMFVVPSALHKNNLIQAFAKKRFEHLDLKIENAGSKIIMNNQ